MTDDEEGRKEWDELDQSSVRKSLKDIVKEFPETIDDRLVAMKQLMALVYETVSYDLAQHLNPYMDHHKRETAADAKRLAEEVDTWLADLHLAIKHPESGVPCRIALAKTPPRSENESWLELEPLDHSKHSARIRLPDPLKWLSIVAQPTRSANHTQQRER